MACGCALGQAPDASLAKGANIGGAMALRLLPKNDVGWTPLAWLIYLSLYVVYAVASRPSPAGWAAYATALVVFLALYFRGFWVGGRALLAITFAIVALGVVMSPWNPGASVFFVYGAAFLGAAARPAAAIRWLGLILAILALETWLVPLPPQTWIPGMVFSVLIGGTNIHFMEVRRKDKALIAARESEQAMAAALERERIARDLHDLLGHTLSVIVIKSELAAKLADRDPARAASEIRDVERISRNALQEVRGAIYGFRALTVEQELASGRVALEAAGVALDVNVDALEVDDRVEAAVALAVREALTNVIRHAGARRCAVRAARSGVSITLTIEDDGVGGAGVEGTGLAGMRARLAEVGGSVLREGTSGTRLTITVPRGESSRVPAVAS
jgi:two-component system sensor histidine kinase DesK